MLHVACLPFPSHQGTQAALDAMLRASAAAGRPTQLLSYAHGAQALDAPYQVRRIPDFPKVRSLRSGPSLGKIALDARCIAEIRKLGRSLQPEAIIAHHIEAALAALAARVAPVYYIAHTSLEHELPVYLPGATSRLVRTVARRVEQRVCQQAAGVAAVAPSLATLLGNGTQYLPVPWSASTAEDRATREQARTALGLPAQARIGLYAGNLDRYQGWEHLLEATSILRRQHPEACLLIATGSDSAPARELASRLNIADAVRISGLASERARMLAHAASDFAWIPRRSEGGLPIKMLDAFAREVPVVAMKRATAGLPLESACAIVTDDSPGALADAAHRLLGDQRAADALRLGASRYLSIHHSNEWFSSALRQLLGERLPMGSAKPGERHRRAAPAPRAS